MATVSLRTPTSWLLLATSLAAMGLVGCDSGRKGSGGGGSATRPAPARDLSDPKQFFAHLYELAKNGDAESWASVLSKKYRDRGDAYIRKHYAAWSKGLVQMVDELAEGDPNRFELTQDPEKPEWYHLKVGDRKITTWILIKEDGALRLNEQ